MKSYCAYIRVSTAKQGAKGVSLEEQRSAITRYATDHQLSISLWFEERGTAAAFGRPVFRNMLQRLEIAEAQGVIMHKIDRGARNLKDWADLGELLDRGVDVRFAGEGLDLRTRGGRLSADIQAAVAADFVRNLREETKKGFYGRLKQGLYPLPAPLGYLDNGGGEMKTLDPVAGPLIRELFMLCLADDCSLAKLSKTMADKGLRGRSGDNVSPAAISRILRNPFYTGHIEICGSQSFLGRHEPLISPPLYEEVQNILRRRKRRTPNRRFFVFSRMIMCPCGYALVGEFQKGHVYYRCHTSACPTKCMREDTISTSTEAALSSLPDAEVFCFAYRRSTPTSRRLLLKSLGTKITVRGLVRGADGVVTFGVLEDGSRPHPELNRIAQDILFAPQN